MIGEKTSYYLGCDEFACQASTVGESAGSVFEAEQHAASTGWRLYRYISQPSKRHKPRVQRIDYCPGCSASKGLESREAEKKMSRTGRRVERFNGERWVLVQEASRDVPLRMAESAKKGQP